MEHNMVASEDVSDNGSGRYANSEDGTASFSTELLSFVRR